VTPTFLLLCDERRCGCFSTGAVPPIKEAEIGGAVAGFIKASTDAGWVLGIDRHLCPQHNAKMAEGRRLVEVPRIKLS
jgi:hypothetical protein